MDNLVCYNQMKCEQLKKILYYIIIFFIQINEFVICANRLISSSACFYPHYSNHKLCGIHDPSLLNGWVCDPDNIMSMSEVYIIDDTLQRVYAQNEQLCQCLAGKKKPCWYKFGFAFLRELNPPLNEVETQNGFHCANSTQYINEFKIYNKNFDSTNSDITFLNAQNYARVLREQWNIGECGEDILILVVQNPPKSLIPKNSIKNALYRFSLPMIFVSYGSHVIDHFGIVNTFTTPNVLEPLQRIVDQENLNLSKMIPLNKVLNNLVLRIVESLLKVENLIQNNSHPKNHIPLWAWIIFATCGVTFILMAIGLCLISTTTRRSIQRGKPSAIDTGRRWKAGFVGDDAPPTTYVNLVNLLMPHPRPNQNNQQQQV